MWTHSQGLSRHQKGPEQVRSFLVDSPPCTLLLQQDCLESLLSVGVLLLSAPHSPPLLTFLLSLAPFLSSPCLSEFGSSQIPLFCSSCHSIPFVATSASNQVLTVSQSLIHFPLRVDSALAAASTTKVSVHVHLAVLRRRSCSFRQKIRTPSTWWMTNDLTIFQAISSMPSGRIQEVPPRTSYFHSQLLRSLLNSPCLLSLKS